MPLLFDSTTFQIVIGQILGKVFGWFFCKIYDKIILFWNFFIETINISYSKNSQAVAILTAESYVIHDGGKVKIMAEISGVETTKNDYFTIQCGPAINSDDILDAVAPRCVLSTPFSSLVSKIPYFLK